MTTNLVYSSIRQSTNWHSQTLHLNMKLDNQDADLDGKYTESEQKWIWRQVHRVYGSELLQCYRYRYLRKRNATNFQNKTQKIFITTNHQNKLHKINKFAHEKQQEQTITSTNDSSKTLLVIL